MKNPFCVHELCASVELSPLTFFPLHRCNGGKADPKAEAPPQAGSNLSST